jgi:hypothetical protein
MKSKARARWARVFAQLQIPKATKALAVEFALRCWKELTEDLILSTWDFDQVSGGDVGDDGNDDDDALVDGEYGHDDLDDADLGFLAEELPTFTADEFPDMSHWPHISFKWCGS